MPSEEAIRLEQALTRKHTHQPGPSCTFCDLPLENVVGPDGGSQYHSVFCLNGVWDVAYYVGCAVDIWETD